MFTVAGEGRICGRREQAAGGNCSYLRVAAGDTIDGPADGDIRLC